MERTLAQLAAKVGGSAVGDGTLVIRGVAGLEEAGPSEITFLANPKYASRVADSKAGAIVVGEGTPAPKIPAIVVKDPNFAFIQIAGEFARQAPVPKGIHPTAVVPPSARLGRNVALGAYTVVSDEAEIGDGTILYPQVYVGPQVRIGKECILHAHVSIREQCTLGDRVLLNCGTVIGSDGFGFATVKGVHHKIPQSGIVEIGDDVEMGANCMIDRARFDKTIIKKGTKLDNMVHVGHNVIIGEHVLIAAGTVIAGSSRIEHHVMISGQVAVAGHLTVGAGAILVGQAGLNSDVPPGAMYGGTPARPFQKYIRALASTYKAAELNETIRALQKRVDDLEKRLKP